MDEELHIVPRYGYALLAPVGEYRHAVALPSSGKDGEGRDVLSFTVLRWFDSYESAFDYIVDLTIAEDEAMEHDSDVLSGVVVEPVQALNGPTKEEA